MRVHDDLVKCVAFVCVEVSGDESRIVARMPVGTCFFVGVPEEGFGTGVYAITARHVIDAVRQYGTGYLRVNKRDGGYIDCSFDPNKCLQHSSTDVALITMKMPDGCDILWVPLKNIGTIERIAKDKIGIGDEVFFVGLFSEFPGYERNQPVLRFGNIAMMPRQKLHLSLSSQSEPKPVSAYLIESISWGGESGSPAFVHLGVERAGSTLSFRGGEDNVYLLGLVHGHYPIRAKVNTTGDILGSATVDLNAGMAVVIPAQDIIDLLMKEEVVRDRQKAIDALKKTKHAPTPDSDVGNKDFTRDDFIGDLNKVVKRKSEKPKSDEGNSQT